MPNQTDVPSHCVVQWDDKNDEYAVVDTRRSKTVATMKIGSSTLFEGYQRERRRGKILFLGTKKDCMVYGYDVVECDTQLNVYSWSSPPGLREQAAEVSNAIRGGVSSTFQRTVSSSSTTSINKSKRKRAAEKIFNEIGEQTAFNDICTTPSSTSTGPSSSSEKRVVDNPTTDSSIQSTSSNSNIQSSTSSTSTSSTTNTSNNQTSKTNVADVEALLEQIKALEEKNMALQEELIDKQENSIPIPSEEVYLFFKLICDTYEKIKSTKNNQAIEIGKQLPCTHAELVLAKKTNPAATINKLVECCFKDVHLSSMCYEKLKAKDPNLIDLIYKYVQLIHAPTIIPQGRYSDVISKRCRHVRSDEKNKSGGSKSKKFKSSSSNNKKHPPNKTNENEDIPNPSNEVIIDNDDEDKENSFDLF